jgi:hypothetical protein
MVFAIALISPLPKHLAAAAAALVRRGLVRLATPVLLGTIVVVTANAGPGAMPARHLLTAAWWTALLTTAIQAPRFITDLGDDAVQPAGPTRLRASIYLLTAANLAISVVFLARTATTHHLLPAVTAALIAALVIPLLTTRRDLGSFSFG